MGGLLIELRVAEANGTAECDQSLLMLLEYDSCSGPITAGADKATTHASSSNRQPALGITPHIHSEHEPQICVAVNHAQMVRQP